MLGVSVPLVQEARDGRRGVKIAAAFAAGAVLSAALTGAVVLATATTLPPANASSSALVVVAGVLTLAALSDLRLARLRTLTVRRQTSPLLLRRFGEATTFFVWGLDLGTGWSTIRQTSLFWGLTVFGLFALSGFATIAVFGLYGATLAVTLATVGLRYRTRTAAPRDAALWALAQGSRVRVVSAGLLLLTAGLLALRVA